MFRKKYIIFLFFSLLVSGYFFIGLKEAKAADNDVAKPAPDFALLDIYGNPIRLSDFKGKVVLIDFWATWCPYCRQSIPILLSLYKDYKKQGFEIIGVALEYDGGRILKNWLRRRI